METQPDSAGALHNLGVVDLEEGRLEPARMRLSLAVCSDLGCLVAHYSRDSVYARRGEIERAFNRVAIIAREGQPELAARAILG